VDVLVVDDDADVRGSMVAVLRLDGLSVVEAGDGQAAMNVLERTEVGAVVVDLHMTPRDGVWLLEQMTDPPVVIIVSAFALYDENDIRDRFADTVAHYLRKPVAPATLIETLRRSLGSSGS
jgi:CheY-like chemotaxis protein